MTMGMTALLALTNVISCVVDFNRSFFSSSVFEDGLNPSWRALGDSLTVFGPGKGYANIHLGYDRKHTKSLLESVVAGTHDDFAVEIYFNVRRSYLSSNAPGAVAVWFDKEKDVQLGDCFGRACEINGGIFVVVFESSLIRVYGLVGEKIAYNPSKSISENFRVSSAIKPNTAVEKLHIRIIQKGSSVIVRVGTRESDTRHCFTLKGVPPLGKGRYLGISSSSSSDNRVSFSVTDVLYHKGSDILGRRSWPDRGLGPDTAQHGSGRTLLIVVLVVVILVAAYLTLYFSRMRAQRIQR